MKKCAVLVNRFNCFVAVMLVDNDSDRPDVMIRDSLIYHLEEAGIVPVYKESVILEVK